MPSYIIYDDQHPKCGQIAVNRLRNKSKYIVFDSKRILGRDLDEIIIDPLWPFNIREINNEIQIELANMSIVKSPEEISGVLLKHIKKCVDEFQGRNIKEVVIAIPSTFTLKQANATLKAAKLGGWENIHFIPEPVAAAFAYCTKKDIENDSKILVFDCGGKVIDGQINVLSYDGDSYLGGRDYDNLLFNYFNGVLIHKYNIDVMASNKKYVLMQKCNEIKRTLSVEERFWLDVNEFDPDNDEDIIPITINDFEAMANSYKLRITKVLLQSLKNANLQKSQIKYVFQVGGGCRMPMIKKLLTEIFPIANHQCSIYPDWVVAHGAALYAYECQRAGQSEKVLEWKQNKTERKSIISEFLDKF